VFLLGFLLCPWFDLTFHRVHDAGGGGRAGAMAFHRFGWMFAPMILVTAWYAVHGITTAIAVHILVQSWFTMSVHLREVEAAAPSSAVARRLALLPLVALPLVLVPGVIYTHWLVFYGLVFPAIAVLVVGRRLLGRPAAGPLVVTAYVLASAPFYHVGFITLNREWVLVVPLAALVILLVAPRRDRA